MSNLPQKFDVIAFDWDGTLADSVPYKLAQNQALAYEFGNNLTLEQVRTHWNEASGFNDLMTRLCRSDDMDAIMEVVKRDYSKPEFAKRAFSFGKNVLERVRRDGVRTALITNVTRQILSMDAPSVGIDPVEDYFDFTQTADEHSFKKPDPKVFSRMLKTLDVLPSRVLYIGDELKDFYAARDAGMAFMGVETGMAIAEEFLQEGACCVQDANAAVGLFEAER